MWQFQYKHGDRPLEGFTIQRAAGRGGFGEVYYALSDGGREVALKAVTGYEQIELRGISQCMNLKNPHLVSIHDVKYNDQGRPFVIMEFVSGPNLRQILDESPGGLGAQKAAFFLREMGKGLTFLHDCGIVHRDLKPANVFFENGYVKIGDYGLSKAIAPTQHSGQTITVGTVHYMAPEIGGGRYDKSIDIYALGAVLHEMLTGQPPFLGGSAGEILMKHVATEPDVAGIEEPFRTVIKKSMAKNPAERYQSVQEMIEGVFGSEHIQQSVSCFRPESLSMIADRVARRVAVGGGSATPPPIPNRGGTATAEKCWDGGERLGRMIDRFGERMGQFGNRLGMKKAARSKTSPRSEQSPPAQPVAIPGDPPLEAGDPLCDPLSKRQRRVLALIMLVLIAAATGIFSGFRGHEGNFVAFWGVILGTFGANVGLLLAGRRILPQMDADNGFLRHIASGGTASAMMMLFGIPIMGGPGGDTQESIALTAVGALIAFLLVPPPDLSPSRPDRVHVGHAMLAALLGFIAWIFTQGNLGLLIAIVTGANLMAQLCSPWDPFAARRKLGLSASSGNPTHNRDSAMPHPNHPADAPTLAWMSSPPPVPADYTPPARAAYAAGGESLSRREQRRLRKQARRQARWNEASAWRVRGVPFYVRVGRFIRGLVVGTSLVTLLLIATAAALYLALDIPGMLAAGIPDRDIPREFTQHFGFSRWPQMLRGIGYFAAWVPMMMAAMVLIVSRRGSYGTHMFRGVAGAGMFGLALLCLVLSTARSSWLPQAPGTVTSRLSIDSRRDVVFPSDVSAHESESELEVDSSQSSVRVHRGERDDDSERVTAAIDHYLEQVNGAFLVSATGSLLLSLLLICWPANRGDKRHGDRDTDPIAPVAPAVAEA